VVDLRQEPLSPELALVSGELRAAAIASLPERPWRSFAAPPARITPIATAATRPLAVELALYALWQLLVGAMLGFGAVAAVGVAMLVVGTVV